jgi:hypothetical protein
MIKDIVTNKAQNKMKKIHLLSCILICIFLCGCFQREGIKSNIVKGASLDTDLIRVHYQSVIPMREITIVRTDRYAPKITDDDKRVAKENAVLMDQLLQDGFKNLFPIEAQKYGLTVTDQKKNIPYLTIYVDKVELDCNPAECLSQMHIKGLLFDAANKRIWDFYSPFFSPMAKNGQSANISNSMFMEFQKSILEAMKKDGVFSQHIEIKPPVKDVQSKQSDITQQPETSNKPVTNNKPISKVDVITSNNSAPANIAELNRILAVLLTKELRTTCIKEVNGLPTINKDAPDPAEKDINYNLLVKPEILNDDSPENEKIAFHTYLHRLPDLKSSPNKENMVWDAQVSVNEEVSSINKDKLGKIAHLLVKLMAINNLIPSTCNGK